MKTYMDVVDPGTGEAMEFDEAAAERRAERITLRLDAIADNYAAVMPMIRDAIAKRDDLALGYRSPGDYVADRFGRSMSNLGIQVRRAVVSELTEAGLSTRAIAPVVGVSQSTVRDDVQVSRDYSPDTHDNPSDVATGGEVISPGVDRSSATEPPEVEEPGEEVESPSPAATPSRPVVGIDGKTYARPEKKAPPRRPLPDQFFDAAYDMGKAVEKVARLTEDDRFPQNVEKVAAKHRNDLIRSRDLLQQVIDQLSNES